MNPRTYDMALRAEAQRTTYNRILEAATEEFLEHPYEDVTLAGIAEGAGVSHQTVLNHFGSKGGVFAAFGEWLYGEIQRLRERAVPGNPRSTVDVLLDQYERFGDANTRWDLFEGPAEPELDELSGAMAEARSFHRDWLERQFAPWLDLPAGERDRRLALLYVATDVKTWKLLRRQLDFGRRVTGELMLRLIEAAVGERIGTEGDRS